MLEKIRMSLVLLLIIAPIAQLHAQKTWTGASSTNWSTAANWSPAGVPGNADQIIINATTNQPILSGNRTIGNGGSITINSGASLTITGSISINGNGQLHINGGELNHSGSSFNFPFNSHVSVLLNSGKFSTNATNFKVNSTMEMNGGELVANAGLAVHSGKSFVATAGKIRVNGHLDIQSSNSTFFVGSDSLIVNGRITLNSNTSFYGGSAKIVINRQSGQNNQLSGNWFTQNATVVFNPSSPPGNNLTNISSSGAVFRVGQGNVMFMDSIYVGNNATLWADSGVVTFNTGVQVSSDGTINNDIGTLNFQGSAVFTNTGTLNAGSGSLNFGGDVVVNNNNGNINAGSSTIIIEGDISTPGNFNAGTSTVILAGDSTQSINNDITFYNLEIQTTGTVIANGNVIVLNDGVIGDNTTLDLGSNQLNVQGELTDNGGNLAVATDRPFVVNAWSSSPTTIVIEFNETLNNTATNTANYSISPSRVITNASLNGKFVTLTVTVALDENVEYTITMNNIQNLNDVTVNSNHIKRFNNIIVNAPNIQATNVQIIHARSDSLTVVFTRGNGARRLVVARVADDNFTQPNNNTAYAANNQFGNGAQIGTGNFVVYNGTDSFVVIRNLDAATLYQVRVYEFNGGSGQQQYAVAGAAQSAARFTLSNPATQQTQISVADSSANSITISMTPGNGNRRLVIVREGALPDFIPVNSITYTADTVFGSGEEVSTGQYVVYNASGNGFALTGLNPLTSYGFLVYEYNAVANSTENYLLSNPASVFGNTLLGGPTLAAHSFRVLEVAQTSISLAWARGDGDSILITAREAASPNLPADAQFYAANAGFGQGASIGVGSHSFAIYRGTDTSVTVSGLQPGQNYQFNAIEFSGAGISYLSTGAVPFISQHSLPADTTSNVQLVGVNDTSMQFDFDAGSGEVLIVVKANEAVNAMPVRGQNYNSSTVFGVGSSLADGSFVVGQGSLSSISVSGLDPNTVYHWAWFDFAGPDSSRAYYPQPTATAVQHSWLRLQAYLWLEGPFDAAGDSMSARLDSLIPTNQPYNQEPWLYAGTESLGLSDHSLIVDWVYVQLRKSSTAANATSDSVVFEAACLLWSDGRITNTAGDTAFLASISAAGPQYLVVYHRTHIPVMSAQAIQFNGNVHDHDFRNTISSAFGTEALMLLPNGSYALFAGRVENQTPFLIDEADRNASWSDRNLVELYAPTDAALEGLVDATDRSLSWNNRERQSQVP
ncbi:MAG: beta strand repeat-containing protein [Bacteroidia bacterium]